MKRQKIIGYVIQMISIMVIYWMFDLSLVSLKFWALMIILQIYITGCIMTINKKVWNDIENSLYEYD